MNRFVRICTTKEKLRVTLRIENFSVYLCKGVFNSPVLETESKQSKWSFSFAMDGNNFENFTTVRLKREDCEKNELFVEVVSSLDGFGLVGETKTVFRRSDDVQIFTVRKTHMSKNNSLYGLRLLPNDVLTLQCDMVIHTDEILRFSTKEEFDENLRLYRSPDRKKVSEYFVHSYFTKQEFDFTLCVDDFSVCASKRRYLCPEYRSEVSNGEWNLVLYVDDTKEKDFVRIGLLRSGFEEGEIVEVQLSVIDDSEEFGKVSFSAVKLLYYINSMEGEVLSFSKKDKERLIWNDTLHLKCEVSLCKENVLTFATKEEFDTSIHSRGFQRWKYLY